jgi:hypothetical protein
MQAMKQAILFSSISPSSQTPSSTTPQGPGGGKEEKVHFTETLVHIYGLRIFDIEDYQRTLRLAQTRAATVFLQRAYRRMFMKKFLSPSAPRRVLADASRPSATPGPAQAPPRALALADVDDSWTMESSRSVRGESGDRTLSGDIRSSALEVRDLSDLGL